MVQTDRVGLKGRLASRLSQSATRYSQRIGVIPSDEEVLEDITVVLDEVWLDGTRIPVKQSRFGILGGAVSEIGWTRSQFFFGGAQTRGMSCDLSAVTGVRRIGRNRLEAILLRYGADSLPSPENPTRISMTVPLGRRAGLDRLIEGVLAQRDERRSVLPEAVRQAFEHADALVERSTG